ADIARAGQWDFVPLCHLFLVHFEPRALYSRQRLAAGGDDDADRERRRFEIERGAEPDGVCGDCAVGGGAVWLDAAAAAARDAALDRGGVRRADCAVCAARRVSTAAARFHVAAAAGAARSGTGRAAGF